MKPLLAYYGDDFTGSTDALEFLSRAGIRTVLFLEAPGTEQLARYPGIQGIGVAGMTRSMTPDQMERELRPAFEVFKQLGIPHIHYKVCSTFDSSPQIGSIGKAAEVGASVFSGKFIPLLVAAPILGRYTVFGQHFAKMGTGGKGTVYRLDRHPSMSRHPITPMDESDLRLHLAKQTGQSIGLIDLLALELEECELLARLEELIGEGTEIILFDALNEAQLLRIGRLMNLYAHPESPLFSIGSSGIEMALGKSWQGQESVQEIVSWPEPGAVEQVLVVSGSCSPVTAQQIQYATDHGFEEIQVSTSVILSGDQMEESVQPYVTQILQAFQQHKSVILHTSRGTDDLRIQETYDVLSQLGWSEAEIRSKTSQLYGNVLGLVGKGVAASFPLQRLIIAGGDTSSYVARAMGIESVEMMAPLFPGAPLCKAHASGAVDGLEINFKGGQVGQEDYFLCIRAGKTSRIDSI